MTYRDRRLAKAERLRGWADGREAKADAAHEQATTMGEAIPFGQPILTDHYSAGRDRRYRDRIHATMGRAIEHGRKADDMRRRADGIEAAADHAIYSDDPDAVEALEARLAVLESERDRIKRYNATARKGAADPSILDDAQRESLAVVVRVGQAKAGGPFPGYALSNLSGNIKRNRDRLARLKADQ